MQPCRMSAVALLKAYRSRALSPVEAMQDVLTRVAVFEPHIHATYLLEPERALKDARASEERWRRGEPAGPLDGVPTTIKDNIATKGEPVPLGTAASELKPAPVDAPPVARLRAGAAAGYGPLHLGTDIGGSVRLPAGWCGLVGFKPSGGRVPIDPPYIGRVAGPLTRSVADAALMMATLAQPDDRDYMSLPPENLDWRIEPAKLAGLRIGLLLEAGCGYPTSAPTRAALEGAARDFAAAGAVVEPLAPFLTQDMLDGLDRFWRMRALTDFRATPPERRQKILPFIRAWGESAADFSGETIFHGFSQTLAMRKAAVTATLPYDFVIAPTAPITAFAAELASPSDDPLDPFPHISFTVAFNMSEQPAVSINCGYSDEGLPIGMQIIGRRFDDLGVLRVASAFEAMRAGAARPWPEPPRAEQR
jgi:aspartyl-tRNA(Asn)/glutamyl-tRNA(Gln) amidotransferase subunit A